MRLESVTAEIRPRSDWEAVDLGFAMVRRDFWRCLCVWWLAVLLPVAAAGWWLWESPILWLLVFWWLKPMGSRMVLFEISRRLFGETPSMKSAIKQIPRAWVRRFFYRFLWARLSPWLPVTLAVEDLEGLRGKNYKQRCNQVTRRGESVIMWIYLIADFSAFWFGMALVGILWMFIPEGQDGPWLDAMQSWDPQYFTKLPHLVVLTVSVCIMIAMSLTDLFVTGAGFGIYINNRTWVEGWDVELALKRLAKRLTKVVPLVLFGLFLLTPGISSAEVEAEPAKVIQEVKAAPEFKVHTVTDRVPVPRKGSWDWLERFFNWLGFSGGSGSAFGLGGLELLGRIFVISLVGIVLGVIVWLIWINRHALMLQRLGDDPSNERESARVVMGMDVSPETLPADVPSAAWALWNRGMHQEALGLLYRGAISRVIEVSRVEIQESDTENDCVRRVVAAGTSAHPDYFRGITGAWVHLAYAGRLPGDAEVESLCKRWPFAERRNA